MKRVMPPANRSHLALTSAGTALYLVVLTGGLVGVTGVVVSRARAAR